MKKLIPAVIVLFNIAFLASSYADNPVVKQGAPASQGAVPVTVKLLIADASEIYSHYNKAIELRDKLNQAAEGPKNQINEMIQESRKMEESYYELVAKARNPALTEAAKKAILDKANEQGELIQTKNRQILQFEQQSQADLMPLMERNETLTRIHLQDMKDVCETIAKAKGANLVLNSTLVMYADKNADITQEAIQILNARN